MRSLSSYIELLRTNLDETIVGLVGEFRLHRDDALLERKRREVDR